LRCFVGDANSGGVEKPLHVYCDGLGCVHAGYEATETIQLSKRTWRQVGSMWLRVEMIPTPADTWDSRTLKGLSLWRRLVNRLGRRSCGKCFYFDRSGAQQWRMQATHNFLNGIQEAMWDDVTKISAADHQLPDFEQGELGYCPRKDCGLAAHLAACGDFRRRRTAQIYHPHTNATNSRIRAAAPQGEAKER
jgi:hypothetical protein